METIEAHAPGEDVLVALPGDDSGAKRLLALREGVPLAVNQRIARAQRDIDPRIEKMAADVIVPFERLGELLDGCDAEAGRRQLDLAVWGHISDGNLHPNVIVRNGSELDAAREAVLAFGREAIRLGGAPMAEHGVGRNRIKQTLLAELYGPAGVEAMRAVKRALDPEGRLAPGVLFQQVG
jgi:FAD/FMN-containing dehydrogenase